MKKIAVFASGSGSDFQSIIDGVSEGRINGEIVLLIASKEGIFAIERAKKAGIAYKVFDKSEFETLEAMDKQIIAALDEAQTNLVVLAGYLNILTPALVSAYRNKIINIHPSLIPNHCGKGFYGMRVHRAVIAAGDKTSGATVHFVDEGADTGAIIMQKSVPVLEGDTAESLQQRVLELEHKMLPEAVAMLCEKD